eukprot:705845-Rhodomonas_salina.1
MSGTAHRLGTSALYLVSGTRIGAVSRHLQAGCSAVRETRHEVAHRTVGSIQHTTTCKSKRREVGSWRVAVSTVLASVSAL